MKGRALFLLCHSYYQSVLKNERYKSQRKWNKILKVKKIERNQIRIFIYRFQTPEKDNYIFIYFLLLLQLLLLFMCVCECVLACLWRSTFRSCS